MSPSLFNIAMMVCYAYGGCLLLQRFAGSVGLMVFQSLAMIIANIQVMKIMPLPFCSESVAMGTEVMMASFFATDLLCEFYGHKQAQQGVLLSFISYGFFTLFLITTVRVPLGVGASLFCIQSHDAITHLFSPSPIFLCASILAAVISQMVDILIFTALKNRDGEKNLRLFQGLFLEQKSYLKTWKMIGNGYNVLYLYFLEVSTFCVDNFRTIHQRPLDTC